MPARRRLWWWLWMPVSLFLNIRRSMTGASASLLLVAIISLNIVWGYPWMGMFSATTTLLVVGIAANRLFGPRLVVQLSPPTYAVLGEAFSVTMHLNHRGHLPTFDNRIGFVSQRPKLGASRRPSSSQESIAPCDQQSSQLIPFIDAKSRLQTHLTLRGSRRGIHHLPPVESRTLFPFHLFKCRRRWHSHSNIAIAPKPLDADDDPMFGRLMDQMNRWTQRWRAGDSFDFAGNREYVFGMPVRRWDFRSWARLGRPIVQEFQSPSMRIVTIVVDASLDHDRSINNQKQHFEQLLRWVVTAVEHWSRLSVATRMYISSDSAESFLDADYQGVSELPKLMVQLAGATMIEAKESEQRIETVLGGVDINSVILFTAHDRGRNDHNIKYGKADQNNDDREGLMGQVQIVRYDPIADPQHNASREPAMKETAS